ncbi:MAG: dockerin type I repeat-containing protein, partial [Acutalibacteraceae bacterium]
RPAQNISFYLSDQNGRTAIAPTEINEIYFASIPGGFDGKLVLPVCDVENDYEYYWGSAEQVFDVSNVSRVCIEVSGTVDILVGDAYLSNAPFVNGIENGKTYKDDKVSYSFENGSLFINYEEQFENGTIDATGNYYVSFFKEDGLLCEEYNFTYIKNGDLNGDGAVNTGDLVLLKQHLLGVKMLEGPYMQAADSRGTVDIRSLVVLKKMLAS